MKRDRKMIRAKQGVKLIKKRNSQELMDCLGLEETLDRLAKANGVQWCRQILKMGGKEALKS